MSSAIMLDQETLNTERASCNQSGKPPSAAVADRVVDVSVCIANWNCRQWLSELLQSLDEDLQGVRVEIIVVDNASTDGAAEMAATKFPHVHLIRNKTNRGFSVANNQAAQAACGRYVFFLNNDTVVPPGVLRGLFEYAETHPEAGIIGPRLRGMEGEVQVSYRCRPSLASLLHRTLLLRWTGLLRRSYLRYRRQEFDPEQTREVDILMGAAVFMRRSRFLRWGGWDEDFSFGGEDMELSVRVGQHARLIYLPEVEIRHHGRVSTRKHIGFAAPNIAIGMARFLRKTGASEWELLLYKSVVTLDAPLTIIVKGIGGLVRCGRAQRAKAWKSWLSVRGAWSFMTRGLWEFWRA